MLRINTTTNRRISTERHNQLSTRTTASTIYFFDEIRPVLRVGVATGSESGSRGALPASCNFEVLTFSPDLSALLLTVTESLHNSNTVETRVIEWLHTNAGQQRWSA